MSKDSGSLSTIQSIWDKIDGIEDHPAVKETIGFSQKFSKESSIEIVIDEGDGYLLVSFPIHDLYMLKRQTKGWQRAYIGYDPEYSRTVLEQKYGLTKLLDAYIEVFEREVPIYGLLLQ